MTGPSQRRGGIRHGGASVAVAMAVMNLALYAYTAIAARLLGPQAYGALASLMAVLLVVSVLQLGVQATAARRIAADPDHVAQIEREILGLTYRAAAVVGVGMLVLSPLIDRLLRLDNLMAAAVVAATAVPITISGGQIGVLQGERRWWPVSVLYLASGIPRLVFVTSLILWRPTELAAIVGVFLGAVVPVVIGAVILRRTRKPGLVSDTHATGPVVREIVSNSQTLLAFLSLTVCDVILARNILDEHDAGLYAGGLILTKAMLFLPQFVVVVAFPAMATAHERRRALFRSLTLIAGLGAVGVLACALLPQLALIFVGGDDYAEIADLLWMFAALGTLLSLIQLLVYAVLARQGTRSVYIVWGAVAVLVVVGLQLSSLKSLLLTVGAVDSALFATLLVISLRRLQEPLVVQVPLAEPTV